LNNNDSQQCKNAPWQRYRFFSLEQPAVFRGQSFGRGHNDIIDSEAAMVR
jgi:hypothetical protein